MPATVALWVIRGLALAYTIYRAHKDQLTPPRGPSFSRDPIRNPKRTDLPVQIVYGENQVVGNIIQQHVTLENEGTPEEKVTGVEYILGLGEGPIERVQNVSAEGAPVTYLPGTTYMAQASGFAYQFGGRDNRVNFQVKEADVGGYIKVEIEQKGGNWPELRKGKTYIDFWGHAIPLAGTGDMRNNPGVIEEIIQITSADVGWWSIVSFLRTTGKAHIIRVRVYRPQEETEETNTRTGERIQPPYQTNWETQNYPFLSSVYLKFGTGELTLLENPAITSIIRGRKVKVWDGSQWVEQYSNNPAWCLLDLITNNRYGDGKPLEAIDLDSFIAGAQYCDQLIDVGGPGVSGEQEKRFEFDLVFDTERGFWDNARSIMATFRASLLPRGEKQALHIDRVQDPVQHFTDGSDELPANIIEGSFGISKLSLREKPNRIIVEYIDPERNYEPTRVSAENSSDIEKNGLRPLVVSLYGIKRRTQARRTAQYLLNEIWLCDTFISWGAGIDSIHCEMGDIITLTHSSPGWVDKKIRILDLKEQHNDELLILGQEYNPSIYIDEDIEFDYQAPTTLPNPNEEPGQVTDLELTETGTILGDGTYISGIRVSWVNPPGLFFNRARVFIKQEGQEWDYHGAYENSPINIKPLSIFSKYYIKVVAENRAGKTANFNEAPQGEIELDGKNIIPTTPTGLTVIGLPLALKVQYDPNPEPDIEGYEVHISTQFDFNPSEVTLERKGLSTKWGLIDLEPGETYYIRVIAYDRSGNKSAPTESLMGIPLYIDDTHISPVGPPPPENFTMESRQVEQEPIIDAYWYKVEKVREYHFVWRRSGAANWTSFNIPQDDFPGARLHDLLWDRDYEGKVRCIGLTGVPGVFTDVVTVKTPSDPVPTLWPHPGVYPATDLYPSS